MDGSFDPRPQFKESEQPTTAPIENPLTALPTPTQQSWGTVISIVLIVLMVIVGAFYSWGKRLAEERALVQEASSTTAGQ